MCRQCAKAKKRGYFWPKNFNSKLLILMADGVGFEPTNALRRCRFSRPIQATRYKKAQQKTTIFSKNCTPLLFVGYGPL
jgi:hypothetical protein